MDKYFRVEVISKTPNPQQTSWLAMHQDYAEGFVADGEVPSESNAGEYIVKHCLAGNRGHFGILEHSQIILNCGWFPHSTMQQLRTHRVGISFDVQSGRYTSQRILDVVEEKRSVEEVFYFRPVGNYTDRSGKKYEYTEDDRRADLNWCYLACQCYQARIEKGFSEEHARDLIPYSIRQHFVMSVNLRSLMHLLLIRGKKDAQLECQQLCKLILPHFQAWAPNIYDWFIENLWLKGRLAP
jgi:thymidylate synthase (FAD)